MKKIDLGQMITILGNVGVIAGIVFLGLELRQSNEQSRLQAEGEADVRRNAVLELVIENPDLIELLAKDEANLTQSERDRLILLGLRVLLNMEELYHDVQRGMADSELTIRTLRAIYWRPRLNYAAPLAWETIKERADPAFIQWMEENVVNER